MHCYITVKITSDSIFWLVYLTILASGVVSIESNGELVKLEQYYLDLLDPDNNILKVAYSLKGYVYTEETKVKFKA